MLIADHAQLGVVLDNVVVRFAVRVGAVYAVADGQFATVDTMMPGAEPFFSWHFIATQTFQMVHFRASFPIAH